MNMTRVVEESNKDVVVEEERKPMPPTFNGVIVDKKAQNQTDSVSETNSTESELADEVLNDSATVVSNVTVEENDNFTETIETDSVD